MSNILGISAGFHDAAISVLSQTGDILYASHSERYSKRKNDPDLNLELIQAALEYGDIDNVAYYERPWLKQTRQLYSGQGIDWDKLSARRIIDDSLNGMVALPKTIKTYSHHMSHAAAGFQTSPFQEATVVVIDAIGEWETITIWEAYYDRETGRACYDKRWSQRYPHSIGLLYSAATSRVGLRPLDEEYILMGMAAYGRDRWSDHMKQDFVDDEWNIKFKHNLHVGMGDYRMAAGDYDIAASTQTLTENLIYNVMRRARNLTFSRNLVFMGGVALNCSANRNLGDYFDDIWIMPNPGDAGSSLGAAALAHGKQVHWKNAFLGHNIPGDYPINNILDHLLTDKIVGVASGRAEFGPRAFGNRSLLADPRGDDIKDRVNEIKRRQKFRPFAPVIMEEIADQYFDMPQGFSNSRYMQTVADCRFPWLFPAVVHADGTSRVQTVPKDRSGIRKLLERWYVLTGCPMLLNTSLNIRGEPMVNDRADADLFELAYGINVCS